MDRITSDANLQVMENEGIYFVNIRGGEKIPHDKGWQTQKRKLGDIDQESIGILLGESSGVMALDFDGQWAIDYVDDLFPGINLESWAWSSGKDASHFQILFRVPESEWSGLRKINADSKTSKEQLEFRWTGHQSVLPPSIHPSGRHYQWLTGMAPSDLKLSTIPTEILDLWKKLIALKDISTQPQDQHYQPSIQLEPETEARLCELLVTAIQRGGRLSYTEWRDLTWSVIKWVGKVDARQIMTTVMPEQKRGEYDVLFNGFDATKTGGSNVVAKMAKPHLNTLSEVEDTERRTIYRKKLESKTFDDVNIDDTNVFPQLESNSKPMYFISAECGQGKSHFMNNWIADNGGLYVIALPKIDLIKEFASNMMKKSHTHGIEVRTIFSQKGSVINRSEDSATDETDDDSRSDTVSAQLDKVLTEFKGQKIRNGVIYMTHAALALVDTSKLTNYELFLDEIPDVSYSFVYDFKSPDTQRLVNQLFTTREVNDEFFSIQLTNEGEKFAEDSSLFDDVNKAVKPILDAIVTNNMRLYCEKSHWEKMSEQKIQFIAMCEPGYLDNFKKVTLMGDEFENSLMHLVWKRAFNIDFLPRTEFNGRQRAVSTSQRVQINYFVDTSVQKKASKTSLTQKRLEKARDYLIGLKSGAFLVSCNKSNDSVFPQVTSEYKKVNGVVNQVFTANTDYTKVAPRIHGSNEYMALVNAFWCCAMRPDNYEMSLMKRLFGITEDEIIEWREYNAMYQFLMRVNIRDYNSSTKVHLYVWDTDQVAYLIRRFGSNTPVVHIDLFADDEDLKIKKVGRKKTGTAMTAAERSKARYERNKAKKETEPKTEPKTENNLLDTLERLKNRNKR